MTVSDRQRRAINCSCSS